MDWGLGIVIAIGAGACGATVGWFLGFAAADRDYEPVTEIDERGPVAGLYRREDPEW